MSNLPQKSELDNIAKRLPVSLSQCVEIAYKTVNGEIKTPQEISVIYNIPLITAISLLSNSVFSTLVHNMMLAIQKHRFNAIALNKLLNIIEYGQDERNQIVAIKAASDIMGVNQSKQKQAVNVNLNFDTMIRNITDKPFEGI